MLFAFVRQVLPGHAFPEIAISAICAAVLRGLVYLHHKKIIHRDLKVRALVTCGIVC